MEIGLISLYYSGYIGVLTSPEQLWKGPLVHIIPSLGKYAGTHQPLLPGMQA
ncbi:hypothetical protein [Parapedobacter koreensis]|uniref:hypothetical protein n=1 Tax=Parapedobacter koreensis TaxID=332977 RepID=UPI0015A723C7|nr:hypothetical protein [Parapedobacter koreensis]